MPRQNCNKEFPEMRTYISYREPNFKVRAGDFRTRLEARKLMQEAIAAIVFGHVHHIRKNKSPKTVTND
jgi:UDP-2,3-diacylglucosamine pyrophosphatase LpxH